MASVRFMQGQDHTLQDGPGRLCLTKLRPLVNQSGVVLTSTHFNLKHVFGRLFLSRNSVAGSLVIVKLNLSLLELADRLVGTSQLVSPSPTLSPQV